MTQSDNDSCVGLKASHWRAGGHMLSVTVDGCWALLQMGDFNGAFKTIPRVIYGYELGLRPG